MSKASKTNTRRALEERDPARVVARRERGVAHATNGNPPSAGAASGCS